LTPKGGDLAPKGEVTFGTKDEVSSLALKGEVSSLALKGEVSSVALKGEVTFATKR
jgi:hypothetical protein